MKTVFYLSVFNCSNVLTHEYERKHLDTVLLRQLINCGLNTLSHVSTSKCGIRLEKREKGIATQEKEFGKKKKL
jgi:hypothetical protein